MKMSFIKYTTRLKHAVYDVKTITHHRTEFTGMLSFAFVIDSNLFDIVCNKKTKAQRVKQG